MRCTCDPPVFCVSRLARTGVICGSGEPEAATSSDRCITLISASGERRQSALPLASVVNATSPPP
eukprot:4811173-Pleurochrysis_carterae.AAC.1